MSDGTNIEHAGGKYDMNPRRLWVAPALWRQVPHCAAFFPDFEVLAEGAARADGALALDIGDVSEGPWRAPGFNGLRGVLGLVVPGLPGPAHAPDARLSADQAAALPHSRFACPFRARAAGLAETLDTLALWRATEAENRQIGAFLHMQGWKRDAIATAFGHDAGHAVFAETADAALAQDGAVLAWAARLTAAEEARAPTRFWRVEDGFIRSVGLGVNFAPAASLALDPVGMHFDATRPSRLETLLRETVFDAPLLARAAALRAEVTRRNITKYNLPGAVAPLPETPGRTRILVVGQVEDDASIRTGAGAVRTNLGLLQAVRAAHPDACIIWKPHPDVETGYRRGYLPARDAARIADIVLPMGDIRSLFAQVDALHTMTSLAGFEALLRGLPVTCWGRPFYAGWGLTTDMEPCDRRGRALTLDELVAGCLILYPRYQDPLTGLPCPPELLLERLGDTALWPALPPARRAWVVWWKLQGRLLRALRHWRVVPR